MTQSIQIEFYIKVNSIIHTKIVLYSFVKVSDCYDTYKVTKFEHLSHLFAKITPNLGDESRRAQFTSRGELSGLVAILDQMVPLLQNMNNPKYFL